jgi:diguanylate cyclase (GGDEF)-like protein
MNPSELFSGTISHIYSASLIIMILILMFIMSLSLFLNRRKKAYFSLTISLFIVIFQYALMITVEASTLHNAVSSYLVSFLNVLSFILINMGIYQLYNPSRMKQYLLFYGSVSVAFIVSLLHFSVNHWFKGNNAQIVQLQDLGMDLYLYILIFVCYFIVAQRIGQTQKYQIGLTLYFIMHVSKFINEYFLESNSLVLAGVANFLPVAYYAILFVILFERVVELLQSSYTNSITDGLTGLYNRRYFVNRVNQSVNSGGNIAIIFADIDNFKKLNDTKGHQKGDEALRQVAQIMKETSDEIGICGRYGGEEIVVLVTNSDTSTGDLAEAIRIRVENEAGVTISIGYSKLQKGITAEQLIKQADEAMYKAKSTGKNKVVKYIRPQSINYNSDLGK